MESKKINQLATELAPELSDLTIIGDPTTGISKKITLSQMASLFTGTVEEYASLSAFPLVGTADTIYIALDTNILYRWNTGTSAYVELSPNVVSSLVFNDANGFDGTISLVGSVATLTITTALTQGSVPFIGASGALTQDNTNFFWDNSNKRLGINTNTPTGALDVFGSGIIGRLNGTSTNNAFLGFASAGSNKWSIGNVQSDHRFRIYNEAATSELFTVLPTGEIGIGIANPLTKLHIDGGASALIANLDADVSVAKSVSFRSDNSSRFNIEVSGTESGSNAGANFFIRRYSDAGALIDTPLTITRSTGVVTLASALPISSGGTGSTTQNFVDLTTTQSIGGAKTFTSALAGTSASFTSTQTNLVLNTTTNTSFSKLSFQDNGVEKGTLTYINSAFAATSRRDKLEIANIGGIHFITQNAPLTPDVVINSSGRVGIGIISPNVPLDVVGGGGIRVNEDGASTKVITIRSNFAGVDPAVNVTSNNSLLLMTNNTERARITNAGVLRLNSQATYSSMTYEQSIQYATSPAGIFFGNSFNSNNNVALQFRTSNDGTGVQAMTITSTGNVLIGTTGAGLNSAKLFVFANSGGTTAEFGINAISGTAIRFSNAQDLGGSITISSGGGTSYNTSSDYRLKEDFKEISGLEKVLAIKTYNYKWKICDDRMDGVIAHELQEVLPYAVNGEKDGEQMQGVDYSKIVPVLIKAIQELKTEIDILKNK